MATLYLFVGYPGAGKTTVANYICEATGAVHIWADRERQAMFDSPTHSETESQQLYEHLNQKTSELLKNGTSVVFDTSFNFYKDRQHLRHIAKQARAKIQIIHVTTPEDIAHTRATHGSHAERNGMAVTMTTQTFKRIAGHLEPLRSEEAAIELSGKAVSKSQVLEALGLV